MAGRSNDNPRTPQGETTVVRILDAAERLFAERGLRGCGLREVAEAAGIRAPSLYNHFKNKDELYAAVLERAFRPVREVLDAFMNAGDDAYRSPRMLEDMMAVLARRPNIARLLLHESLAGGRHLHPILRGWVSEVFGSGLDALRGSPDRGPWNADELPVLMLALSHMFIGYFGVTSGYAEVLMGDPLSRDNVARQTAFAVKLWDRIWNAPDGDGPNATKRASVTGKSV